MSERRREILLEDLPEEIVVDQILVRLPPKDVGRCRAVSTSWRTATSTNEFMFEHRRHQPSLPILHGHWKPAGLVVFRDVGAGASSQELWPFLPGHKNSSGFFHLCASCDGLLIVKNRTRFYVCNPVIRRHALLPLPYWYGQGFRTFIIGFYRHQPTEEYRVLWVSESENRSQYSLHNLTVGSDESKHITVTMPAVLRVLCSSSYSSPPVHHRGSLHWCPRGAEGGGDIIVFDTEAESFRWMRTPTQLCSKRELFSMKGTLAFWGISTPGSTTINVWVMQDYESELWDFKYRIDLSTVEASRQLYLTSLKKKRKKKTPLDLTVESFNDMAVLNERDLLILFNYKHVLRCDIDGKFLGIVNLEKSQYCMLLTQRHFQESIVPIPYHEMQEEDEESLFSTLYL